MRGTFTVVAVLSVLSLALGACTDTTKRESREQSTTQPLYWTSTANAMSTARSQFQATSLNVAGAPVLVTGGVSLLGGAPQTSAELYWPDAGTFSAAAPMSVGRARHAAVLLNDGTVMAIGGTTANGISREAERYTWAADGGSWVDAAQLANERADHTATVMADGRVLVTGGLSLNSLPIAAAEWWNGTIWVTTLPMSTARAGHTATLLSDGRVLVIGGHDGTNALNSVELMNPGFTSWSAGAPMASRRQFHRAVLLKGTPERVLVAGGVDGNGSALSSAEIYDVATNSWRTVAPLAQARSEHSLTVLTDGGVVAVGGVASSVYLTSAELFLSATDGGVWIPSGCTTTARAQHSAALLSTGRVMVAGGRNSTGPLSSAELHDPNGGLPNGASCTLSCQCASQQCVDGVCCDSACGGACDACNLPGRVGTCTVATGAAGSPSCAPYLCGASASCPASCASDAECVASHRCAGNVCVPRAPDGAACDGNGDCASGRCVQDVCCDSACTGACESCNQPGQEGRCRPDPVGAQGSPSCAPFACNGVGSSCPSTCADTESCDALHYCVNGACVPRKPNGNSCSAREECESNFCTDGVCCGSLCPGSCDACNVEGSAGECVIREKGFSGEPVCGPSVCDGVSRDCPTTCESKVDCAQGAVCEDKQCTLRPAGYIGWSWNCSAAGGTPFVLLIAGFLLMRFGRKRARILAGLAAVFIVSEVNAADDAPLAGGGGSAEVAKQERGGIISALSGLHVGGYVLADMVAEQIGGEVGLTYTVRPVLDVGAMGVLGDNIGIRAVGLLHPGPIGDSRWEPFLQLRAVVHPVTGGLGMGGGAFVGASYAIGPGRIRGGLLGEGYAGPANYWPYAIVAAVGYEADPFQTEVRDRIVEVEKLGPTRFRGQLTDLDDHPIKGRVTFTRGPEGFAGRVLPAEPSFSLEVPPGEYEVVAEAEGFLKRGRSFEIKPGETVVSDFSLRPVPGTKTAQLTTERIEILQSIQFEFDKATILPASFGILDEVVDILLNHPELKIRIEGHTDQIGSAEYNQKLSEQRAQAVRLYLVDKGVSARRLTSVGFGFSKPIAGNDEEGRAKNRRVQFEIVR